MQLYKNINLVLLEKDISKKEFIDKLQYLLKDSSITRKVPSNKTIYAYLNGKISIKIELLPFISTILDTPIDFLLSDNINRTRTDLLKYICKDLRYYEKEYLEDKLNILS